MHERRRRGAVRWLGGLLALLASVSVLQAQDAPDPRLARIRAGLPAPAVQQIETTMAAAREQGLPTGPLLDKAVEGVAKGVAGDRVASAVGALAGELRSARSLLDGRVRPGPTDIAAVADALRRGVPSRAVRRLAETAGEGEPVALEAHILGDLLDHGVSADDALGLLDAWRARGRHGDELRQLPAAVERLMRRGSLPGQAAAAVTGAMRAGGPPGLTGERGRGQSSPPIPPGAGPPSNRGNSKGNGKPPGGGGGPPGGGGGGHPGGG